MAIQAAEPLVGFENMTDVIRGLESERAARITNKVEELIQEAKKASNGEKIDGLREGKKDGGKDGGTDKTSKEGAEGTGKEASDPRTEEWIYGDPQRIDREQLARAEAFTLRRQRALII